MTDFTLRPSQQAILAYTGGKLGISAVPGSGKTYTLSALAADLIGRGVLGPDQEVLIVTLVNSAVDNFAHRIGSFVQQRGLIPHLGYRVRTLHGLAHDIVREKPGRVGLEERFAIVDEREANFIRKEAVSAWLAANPSALDDFLDPSLDENRRDWVRRQQLPDMLDSLCLAFIRSAKDRLLTPERLRRHLDAASAPLPLAEMGWAVFADYQRALAYRGAVDFDDLIRLSYELLNNDDEFLERLRYRYPFILEDEAQDSSELQERILRLLSGATGNWVRVGDPNQAIFETFTTANPRYLRDFIASEADASVPLPQSGRSQPSIIDLANRLIGWTMNEHTEFSVRDALAPPYIEPTSKDDPQRNPPDDRSAIRFIERNYTPEQEISAVVDSLKRWLPDHQDWTVAVLVPRNTRGVELINALKAEGLDTHELLSSTQSTRAAAGALGNVLAFLSDPQSSAKLSRVYQVWRRQYRDEDEQVAFYKHTSGLLRKCRYVEEFAYPTSSPLPMGEGLGVRDWLDELAQTETQDVLDELAEFRSILRRWLEAVTLPIDQLLLTLAFELFTEPADLALAHKLALVLRKAADDHSDWRLPELTAELGVIAKNERRFIGFSSDDSGFDPEQYKGKVVVTTMHKAKGLEWDRVYLMSVNNYDFPSNQPYDNYIAEKWFLRDKLNLEAEALAQLDAALASGEYDWYAEGRATLDARLDYVRERLRLFYVGITRAKRDLIVTWNTGRQGEAQPSLPFQALMG
jgi:DNA helicase-2/ATP-dependent DNA helicase PcrA